MPNVTTIGEDKGVWDPKTENFTEILPISEYKRPEYKGVCACCRFCSGSAMLTACSLIIVLAF